MTQWVPGRHRYITVQGWEPLGNLCLSDSAKNEATPWKSVEPQAGGGAVWHGTWGHHYFTPGNLMGRALAYWNKWSEDWASYDYIQFFGGTIKIPQTATTTWMITFDEYLQTKLKDYNPKTPEDKWGHPGILINDPKTHIIYPPNIYNHKKYYKVKVRPPPGWRGLQRLPDAQSYILLHWLWTWADLTHAFYDISQDSSTQHTCQIAPWWAGNAKLDKWVDRSTYQTCDSNQTPDSWGPFLPCKYTHAPECSLFFMYKLRFKVIGTSIWRPLPRNIQSEGLVPEPKPAPSFSGTGEADKKRRRPQDEADIWPGDLDSDGILTERAYQRITGDHHRDKRRCLEDTGRLRLIHDKLRLILSKHNLLKRR